MQYILKEMKSVIDERVIRTTIEKQRQSSPFLYKALLIANCYDHILFEKPVETLRMLNVPKGDMRQILMELVILERTSPEKTSELLEF